MADIFTRMNNLNVPLQGKETSTLKCENLNGCREKLLSGIIVWEETIFLISITRRNGR